MFHTIILAGNVGKDPEMRYTPSGAAVTSFSVASSRNYKSQGQTIKETIWFRITCWGRQAEYASNYVRKGHKILVEGRLVADQAGNPRTFTRNDGTPGASFEITATNLQLLSSRNEMEGGYNNNGSSAGTAYSNTGYANNGFSGGDMGPGGNYDMDPESDDIPF